MKKLKKSLKNKIKFNVVIFYGPFAVGKYTVAKEFSNQTGYKFFHNHHTYDLTRSLFERDTFALDHLNEVIRLSVFKEIANAKLNTVASHAYLNSYVSKTGLSDPDYVKKVEKIIEKAGGLVYFVKLNAEDSVILKRVVGASRKKFQKLKNPEIMKKILKERSGTNDWISPAPVRNNITIDNSKLSPKQVVKLVKEWIKI